MILGSLCHILQLLVEIRTKQNPKCPTLDRRDSCKQKSSLK